MPARLRLLGAATLDVAGAEITLPVDRRGCLLAYLAAEGGWVSRERLALLFWPDADETTAKRNLRQLILRTRRSQLDPPLDVRPDALRWDVSCDVGRFRRALADGDPGAAVAAYGGRLLDGFVVHDVGGFDAWLEGERDRLRMAFQDVALRRSDELVGTGRYEEAARLLETVHEADPLAEDVLAALVRSLYLSGRRDAAMAAYGRFESALIDELGLEPLESTKDLARRIARGEPLELVVSLRHPTSTVSLAPSTLAGRDAARHAVLTARAPVVLVRGEPGIGKSSLLREALPEALRCGATEGLERLPYHPFAALVSARPELARGLGTYREDLARLVPDVAPGVAPAPVDSAASQLRLAEALARFAEAGGGTVVVDDLQWADVASLETIVYLASRGVRVYGAYRTGEVGPDLRRTLDALAGAGRLSEVDIGPLGEEAVKTLIADLMGRSEGPPAFSRRLWQHTGGNPLFVLETLRSMFESGRLRRDEEGWHTDVDDVTVDYSELTVPEAIEGVIARRLDRLSGEAVRVLEALALARTPLPSSVLSSITGLSSAATAQALDEADTTGFLAGGAFRHDLLRQALGDRVPPARRRLLHALIGEALAGEADSALVAEHWLAAGETTRAREAWLTRAAELRASGLQPAAIEMLKAALARVPGGVDASWLHLGLADAYREADKVDEAARQLAIVRQMGAASAEQAVKLGLVSAWLSFQSGRLQNASEELANTKRIARNLPQVESTTLDLVMLEASIAKEERQVERARELLEPVVNRLRKDPPTVRLVQYMISLGAILDDLERHDEALELNLEALSLAKALGSGYYVVDSTVNLVYCLTELGRLDEAIAAAQAALDAGDYDGIPVLRSNLAASLMDAGRYAEARDHYELLLEQVETTYIRAIALGRLADCLAHLGRAGEARARIDEALDIAVEVELPVAVGSIAYAVFAHGTVAQAQRLARITQRFDLELLPRYAVERLIEALATSEVAASVPDAWWSSARAAAVAK